MVLINSIPRPLFLAAKFLGSYFSLITSLLPALDQCDAALIPDAECESSSLRLGSNLISFSTGSALPIRFLRAWAFWIVFDETSENDPNCLDGVVGRHGFSDTQLQSIFNLLFASYTYSV